MHGTVFQFESFEALQQHLEEAHDDGDLELPCCDGVRDGEWLLVTFKIGDDCTSIAGCVTEHEGHAWVTFEDRDWERLFAFATGRGPSSSDLKNGQTAPKTLEPPPNCRVLVVDDDADVQGIVAEVLRRNGFTAEGVASAEEAFDTLRKAPCDLIIVDWNLPGMTGVEFCRRLKRDSFLCDTPVLFLTAHSSDRDIREAVGAGAGDFVTKPFRARELGARVLGLLERARNTVEAQAIGH